MFQKLSRSSAGPRRKESTNCEGRENATGSEEIPEKEEKIAEEPVRLEVSDVLDLHSFAPRDILAVVEAYLEEARARGFSSVRIIHGKGTGTQRARVHALLSRTPFVGTFQDAPLEVGSWGATVVWFRDEIRQGKPS